MPPAISGQSLLTFPDIHQPGGESYSEPVELDGHESGLFGDAMKDVRQCARTHLCASAPGDTTAPMDNEAGETVTMAPIPPPSAGSTPGLSLLKRRFENPDEPSRARGDHYGSWREPARGDRGSDSRCRGDNRGPDTKLYRYLSNL